MRLSIFITLFLSTLMLAVNAAEPIKTKKPMIHQIYELVDQRNINFATFDLALKDNRIQVQKSALLGLGRIGGKTIINRVAPFLQHKNPQLRQYAALALGLSGVQEATKPLWQGLTNETHIDVKKEIYFALGKLGENNLITKMLSQLTNESSTKAQGYLFQGLGMALTFHQDLKDNFADLNYSMLIDQFFSQKEISAQIGLFLYRIPQIENYLNHAKLLAISNNQLTNQQAIYLSKLIFKGSKIKHEKNKALLNWLIKQTHSTHLNLQMEATRSLANLLHYPQALTQLKKLHIHNNELLAHTALKVIANSKLKTNQVMLLLKKQLQHQNPAMVVEGLTGLIQRQPKDEMDWLANLLKHPSAYVKAQLISQLKNKSDTDFNHLIQILTTDSNKTVATLAKESLKKQTKTAETLAISPTYNQVLKATKKTVTLKTTVGNIQLKMLPQAPYTSWHFVNYAQQGEYDNSYFSRVIGNFVAQGGDSIGNLKGSSATKIREEINLLAHEPMTVGVATSGKDTGTSQFFINTGRNLHLDRHYTIFARVISGQKNVLKMTNGAKILSVSVK